jgi:hypothetical protein
MPDAHACKELDDHMPRHPMEPGHGITSCRPCKHSPVYPTPPKAAPYIHHTQAGLSMLPATQNTALWTCCPVHEPCTPFCCCYCTTSTSMLMPPVPCARSLIDTHRAFAVADVVPLVHALMDTVLATTHDLETQVAGWCQHAACLGAGAAVAAALEGLCWFELGALAWVLIKQCMQLSSDCRPCTCAGRM